MSDKCIYRVTVKPLKNPETTFYTESLDTAMSPAINLDQNGKLLDRFEIQRHEGEIPDGTRIL
jgi:hypothetical protein